MGVGEAFRHSATPDGGVQADRPGEPVQKKEISELVRECGKPAAPGHPDDLAGFDLAAMGGKLLGVMYATDEWVEPDRGEKVLP